VRFETVRFDSGDIVASLPATGNLAAKTNDISV